MFMLKEIDEISKLVQKCYVNMEEAEALTCLMIEKLSNEKHSSIILERLLNCIKSATNFVIKIQSNNEKMK